MGGEGKKKDYGQVCGCLLFFFDDEHFMFFFVLGVVVDVCVDACGRLISLLWLWLFKKKL